MTNTVALAVKVTADTAAAAAGIDGVANKTSKMGQAGKVAGRLLAGGLLLAGAAAVKATQAAAEDEAAQTKLAGALKNATGARSKDIASVEEWISAQGTALGVSDSELRPSLEALVTATKDVGTAQRATSLAMNIAARTGQSVEAVSKKLAKAYATGSVAALSKYGVATKNAAGKTRDMNHVMLDLTKTYQGSAAAAADTAAGKQKKLQVSMGELQEQIGAQLLPVMVKLAEIGLKVVDWISKNTEVVGPLAAALGIATAAVWALNIALNANPVSLIVIAVIALAAALVVAYKKSETFRAIVDGVFHAIATTVSVVVGFIKNNWEKLLVILTGPIGLAVVLIAKHWDTIKAGAVAIITWVNNTWSNLKEKLAGPIEAAKTTIGTALGAIQTAFDNVAGAVQSIIDKVAALIEKLKNLPGTGALGAIAGAVTRGGGSVASGTGITRTPVGGVNIVVNVPGGFIGDDVQLARKIKAVLGSDLRRFGVA